jgi:hypothetical protein
MSETKEKPQLKCDKCGSTTYSDKATSFCVCGGMMHPSGFKLKDVEDLFGGIFNTKGRKS